MHDMESMKTMDNQDLGFYYEVIAEEIKASKLKIVENIVKVFSLDRRPDKETFHQDEEFKRYCRPYRSLVDDCVKDSFDVLSEEREQIKEEMEKRQRTLLKEIGINNPSVRLRILMDQTRSEHFPLFDDLITFTKLSLNQEEDTWPKDKLIMAPEKFVRLCERTGDSIIDVIAYNL